MSVPAKPAVNNPKQQRPPNVQPSAKAAERVSAERRAASADSQRPPASGSSQQQAAASHTDSCSGPGTAPEGPRERPQPSATPQGGHEPRKQPPHPEQPQPQPGSEQAGSTNGQGHRPVQRQEPPSLLNDGQKAVMRTFRWKRRYRRPDHRWWLHYRCMRLEFSSWEVQELFIAARLARKEGRLQDCKEELLAARMLEPSSTRILIDLANVCTAVGDLHEADTVASVAIMLDGKNSLAHYSRAKARRAYGHFAGAMRDLQNCRLRTVVPGHLAGIDKELRELNQLAAATPKEDQETACQRALAYAREAEKSAEHVADAQLEERQRTEAEEAARRKARAAREMEEKTKHMQHIDKMIKQHEKQQLKDQLQKLLEASNRKFSQENGSKPGEDMSAWAKHGDHGGLADILKIVGDEEEENDVRAKMDPAHSELGRKKKSGGRPAFNAADKVKIALQQAEFRLLKEQQKFEAVTKRFEQGLRGAMDRQPDTEDAEDAVGSQRSWQLHEDAGIEHADAAATLLSMSPRFEHRLQPDFPAESRNGAAGLQKPSAKRTASAAEDAPAGAAEAEAADKDGANSGSAKPAQADQAEGQKTAGKKKKKNKKNGPSKAALPEQATAHGIPEGPLAEASAFQEAQEGSGNDQPTRKSAAYPTQATDVGQAHSEEAGKAALEEGFVSPEEGEETPSPKRRLSTDSVQSFKSADMEQPDRQRMGVDLPEASEEGNEDYYDITSCPESAGSTGSAARLPEAGGTPHGAGPDAGRSDQLPWPSCGGADAESTFAPREELNEEPEQLPEEASGQQFGPAEDVLFQPFNIKAEGPEEADYAELRTALKAAKAALDRKDFEGALGHCNDALDLDIHSTPAHLRKAEVFLQMEKYSWSALEYKFVVDNFELSAKDRLKHFNSMVDVAQKLLSKHHQGPAFTDGEALLGAAKKMRVKSAHAARVLYLESYVRLRKAGLPVNLDILETSIENVSLDRKEALFREVEQLLQEDLEDIKFLGDLFLPSVQIYRKLMSEVGKEAGNAYNKERSYGEAHVRYSLAVALDEGNLPALSNRAHTHLMLGDPGAAKEDATQVLDALQAGGVPLSPKIVRELIQKALYRRGKAFFALGRETGQSSYYAQAFDDLAALGTPNEEAKSLLGDAHAAILSIGTPEEIAAVRKATATKTSTTKTTSEELAAMGEDFSGLNMAEMTSKLGRGSGQRAGSLGSGKPWSAKPGTPGPGLPGPRAPGFPDTHQEDPEGSESSSQQRQQQQRPGPSEYSWTNPEVYVASLADQAKRARSSTDTEAKATPFDIKFPGPKGFDMRCPSPSPQGAAAQPCSSSEGPQAQSSAGAASSSEAGSARDSRRNKGKAKRPRQSTTRLEAADRALLKNTVISHQIYKKLLSQGGSMSLTTEEFRHLGWVLSENLARRAYVMAEVGINKVTWRIKELRAMGRLQEAALANEILGRRTEAPDACCAAANDYAMVGDMSAAKRCADAALGMDGECRSALLVHVALFDYAGENSKADLETLRGFPEWTIWNHQLENIIKKAGKQKGRKKCGAKK